MAAASGKWREYQDGKLWFSRKGSLVTIGVTSHAIDEIGEIDHVEFPSDGDDFDKGDVVMVIEGTVGTLEVVNPAAGFVKEMNEVLNDEIQVLVDDPLEEGWLIKIEIQDPSDLEEYVSGSSDTL